MFYGKDFEKNRELMRVIVDETPDDIRMMLDIIKGCRQIGGKPIFIYIYIFFF